jgi:thioredoxin-related protein
MKILWILCLTIGTLLLSTNAVAQDSCDSDCVCNYQLDFLTKKSITMPEPEVVEPKPRLIIFSADWCLPCKVARKQMNENDELRTILEEDYTVVTYNFDKDKDARRKYNVSRVPTYIVELKGRVLRKQTGYGGDSKLKAFLRR